MSLITLVTLNPQPEPPSPAIGIYPDGGKEIDTCQIVTGGGVIEIDLKNHKVVMKYPEKGDPHLASALGAAVSAWSATSGVKGLEDTNALAGQLLLAATQAALKTRR